MDLLNKLLTVILFLNCLFLILLVLVQLPKKEAGLGTAFGGGATDALFGAGAGNVLTKLTKWNAVIFLFLCLLLSLDFMRPKDLSETLGQNTPTVNTKTPPKNPTGVPALPETGLPANPPTPSDSNRTQ
ncbi:MAG: preprotein translocase subunit SecG [Verrucomicrobiota bacterium]|jgi:preprotein translocase subunit SecG|nr:preprotein translocase subunit SecG [Verrucomicrobiota bacterium]